jgi:hypothetical protein
MRVTRYKRQVFLFLAAILVPAAVRVGLASRILYQDEELAAKRPPTNGASRSTSCAGNWMPPWKPSSYRRSTG